MNYIFLNLKRFDIPKDNGGVNTIAPPSEWAKYIVESTKDKLPKTSATTFAAFFPEAHIIPAVQTLDENSILQVGCQGVHREDTAVGKNFGAFTTSLTANAAAALGCKWALIGHYEERKDKAEIISTGNGTDYFAINRILNKEIKCAINAGLSVLYCIGDKERELNVQGKMLRVQLEQGLKEVDTSKVVIAYEPIWAIGPGKIPPERSHIQQIAKYIKEITCGLPVVYGGGLKADNAAMLASIDEIDGGLIALTRFSGNIGFYPDEYIEITKTYIENK